MEFLAVQGRVRGCDDADVSDKKGARQSEWPRHEITFRCQKFSTVQNGAGTKSLFVSELIEGSNGPDTKSLFGVRNPRVSKRPRHEITVSVHGFEDVLKNAVKMRTC